MLTEFDQNMIANLTAALEAVSLKIPSDAALDLSWLRGEPAPHYSSMGRRSIAPELGFGLG